MKHVLAAVDLSADASEVARLAGRLARAADAEVLLLHVAAPDPEFVGLSAGPQHVRDQRARELQEERRALQQLASGLRVDGTRARALVFEGATVETIVQEARRLPADLIVVGSRGRGPLSRALLGSVSSGVLHHAPCPVVVVPPRGDAAEPPRHD